MSERFTVTLAAIGEKAVPACIGFAGVVILGEIIRAIGAVL